VISLFVLILSVVGPVVAALVHEAVRTFAHGPPGPAQVVGIFVLTDLANHVGHVAMHRVPAL
jgi:hypothetical protein